MNNLQLQIIGKVDATSECPSLVLIEKYIPALKGLEGFSHAIITWWFSDFDSTHMRNILQIDKPYKTAPDRLGIFATRSPVRPNPIAITTVEILDIDYEKGIIKTSFIDAFNGTPILDIKPYTPGSDRVDDFRVPSWCSHWPKSFEESGDFPWEDEMMHE